MGRQCGLVWFVFPSKKEPTIPLNPSVIQIIGTKRITQVEMSLFCHWRTRQLWGYHLSFANLCLPNPLFPRWSFRGRRPHAGQGSCPAPLWCDGEVHSDTWYVVSWEVLVLVGHQRICSFTEWLSPSSFLQWIWISLASDNKQHGEEGQ